MTALGSGGEYVTGTGQVIENTHAETDECFTFGCVIHAPTDHHLSHLPTHWKNGQMWRAMLDQDGSVQELLADPDSEAWYGRHRNAAKCALCKDVIESRSRHDFVTCGCGSISVDGGADYKRRVGDPNHFLEAP